MGKFVDGQRDAKWLVGACYSHFVKATPTPAKVHALCRLTRTLPALRSRPAGDKNGRLAG